jgi:hypothetical protein
MIGVMKIRSLLFAVLLVPQITGAQAVITEIMYDPPGVDSGREWIEVYNESTSSIPLSAWKIYEGDANHNIIAAYGGSMLAPDEYAVIATNATKFQKDYPNYTGELFHSAFSLDNGGATLSLRDKSLADSDTVSYDSTWGGLGDGNSLQRLPAQAGAPGDIGNFIPRAPSPGAAMTSMPIPKEIVSATPSSKSFVKSTQKSGSASAIKSQTTQSNVRSSNDAGNLAVVSSQTAAATGPNIDSYWFFALAAVILLAIAAIAGSRHFKKTEWDIIEESPEDV